jgi:hypothetical protein
MSSNHRILPQAVGASEIANRFVKQGFRAENPDVFSESGSIG